MTSEEIRRSAHDFRRSDPELIEEEMAILEREQNIEAKSSSISAVFAETLDYHYVPLHMGGNGGSTHKPSEGSKALIEREVSLEDLEVMTHRFYDLAFQDFTLDKFIRSHNDPHGSRFAKWIHQKLTGSNIWDMDRHSRDLTPHGVSGGRSVVIHDRSSAHAAAWYSPKRPSNEVGRHFTLEECRVWMRLHFWAMRESGVVEKSPSFADYYVRFIGHFVSVYERSATKFARESFRWSADSNNIDKYIQDGRKMNDVLNVTFWKAALDLPVEEVEDDGWPYLVRQGSHYLDT
ncbi:hypothetical protein IV203_030799 [Nitzschia inconspicua]|uniref:Uncharacterized protein n=1 Tax=Nitzschia inconspicua TaxID=303405 RepID=A0A9K3LWP8_9STRA|nr:hypothetical protein IV203_030799 [Nitzschia inconspicua]